ncbi:MAG: nucleoside-diphosphate sugar epimerase [SAR86 cluster bacterium]|uniref:Nucleoside-diphosphate sugar epimerase n=1 Tax=SAR86 cluster bacterium TaxID=2030880 RepID=A0A2A4X305_9GAMM|nr:MAG: nucleoside-diphosphate sugar epimerase [SAR86 cluster bacterium]
MTKNFVDSDIVSIAERLEPFYEELAGKNVLMCGGGGFLGRYFTAVFQYLNREILSEPCKLTVLDNFISANNPSYESGERDNVTFVHHNIVEPYETDITFDYIIQAAGIASPFYYRAFPLETIEVSVSGTKQMLEMAKRMGARLMFFSSSEIYGDPDPKYIPTPESYPGSVSCLGARACYDESKRLGETLCRVYHTHFGVHTNMVRPFNVYGPGMGELDYRVLPNFASKAKSGSAFHIYGDGRQTRTFCYINDAIVGFMHVLLRGVPGEPYNIGNPKPEISMADLAGQIKSLLNISNEVNLVGYPDSYPADEPNRRCPDIYKARTQLSYEPQISLEEGLERFFAWTQVHFVGDENL